MKYTCYWCGQALNNRSFRKYLGVNGGKYLYQHFCDEICVQCYEFDDGINREKNMSDRIELDSNKYYGRKNNKKCESCGAEKKPKEFSYRLAIKTSNSPSSSKRYCFCCKGCIETFLETLP